jgi:hypothetical protein
MHSFKMMKPSATGVFAKHLQTAPSPHRRRVEAEREDDAYRIVKRINDIEVQEALLRSYARPSEGTSAAPETTFLAAAAATPPRADGKRATLTSDDCDGRASSDVAGHAAMVGHTMFAILSMVPPDSRSAAKDGAAAWYDILQCSQDLHELPLGSDDFLERLRKGCADADKGVQLDDEARCNAVALKLHLLGWETDGGATLPLEAKPLIDELGAVLQQDAEFVCASVAEFWAGVARRFCDARHLNNIHVSTASWELSAGTKAELEARSLVAACDIEAVHLLAAPTHPRSLREREPQVFTAELSRMLTALGYAASEDGDSSDEALFLAVQIVASAEELVVSGARCADDLKPVLDKAKAVLLEAGSSRRSSGQGLLRAVALGCLGVGYPPASTRQLAEHADLMPASAAGVLDQLKQELTTDGCFRVSPSLWRLWLARLREAEPYCRLVANPSFRSMAGFWLYRDRQLAALRRFGEMYTKRMPQSDLNAALHSTPHLRAVVCGESRTAVWPHVVLARRVKLS